MKKPTIEFIRSEFEKEGYELLTEVYKNTHQKLDYVCPIGHKHVIRWSDWKRGKRCPYCASNAKLTIEFVRSEFAKEGYELLTKVYENNQQKLNYICSIGHECSISWRSWKSGCRCLKCSIIEKAKKRRMDFNIIKTSFEKEGYTLLTKIYKNNKQKLEYVCPIGHKHVIRWSDWKRGKRCPYCSNNVSKWEKEVKKFLGELNIEYAPNDRTQLTNPNTNHKLELDLWFPQLNKAIECNGLYWHSKDERKECDEIKKQLCKQREIDLLIITDEEWTKNKGECKTNILSFLEDK